MKNSRLFLLIPMLLALVSVNASARDVVLKRVSEFSEIPSHADLYKSYENTIVVMDDDDTLSMMSCDLGNPLNYCQYLGGPAWFDWQKSLLKDQPESEFLVAKDEQGLLDVSSYLLSISNMTYTADDVSSSIRHLVNEGARLMVLTARGTEDVATTNKQFESLNVSGGEGNESLASIIESNAVLTDQVDLSAYIEKCTPAENGTSLVYDKGVVYTSGQEKGPILKCLADAFNVDAEKDESLAHIKNIIFIDDVFENARNMYLTFRGTKYYNMYAMSYGRLDEHKAAFTRGDNSATFQELAHQRWLKIKDAKEKKLPVPEIID